MTERQIEPDWQECFTTLRGGPNGAENLDQVQSPHDDDGADSRQVGGEQLVAVRLQDYEAAAIKLGRRLLAKPHGALSGPNGDPSEQEIKAMTAAIRAAWSRREHRRRAGGNHAPVEAREARAWGTDDRGGR